MPARRDEVLESVRDAIRTVKDDLDDGAAIDPETPLFGDEGDAHASLGLDSLEALEIVSILEERFGATLDDAETDITAIETVDDIVNAILDLVSSAG